MFIIFLITEEDTLLSNLQKGTKKASGSLGGSIARRRQHCKRVKSQHRG